MKSVLTVPPAPAAGSAAAPAPTGTGTATYMSTQSLTFPGVATAASIVVGLYAAVAGQAATPLVTVIVAGIFGAILIVAGLLDDKQTDRSPGGTFVQIIIGVVNTALLAAALLGISEVGSQVIG